MAKRKNKPLTNQQKKEWLERHSERLVEATFKNLEDNFKLIENDYKVVYHEVVTKLVKVVEDYTIGGKINNPLLFQNKFIQIIQLAVGQLTLLDSKHDEVLRKLLKEYHTTITDYQIELVKLAREEGILFTEKELNETALSMAIQFPYKDYPFVSALAKGTIKVGEKLNIMLANKIIEGTSVAKLIPQIEEAFNLKRYEAERIARTETSRVLNQASLNVYKSAGLSKVKWLDSTEAIKGSTVKKAIVCKDCRKVATTNGGIYEIDNVPPLPLHPHCRCTITPVLN